MNSPSRTISGNSTWSRFRSNSWAVVGLSYICLLLVIAIAAQFWTPEDPYRSVLSERLASPSWEHPLGTDDLGRDTLSRMMVSTRISLQAAAQAVAVALALGLPTGLAAGFFGGSIERVFDAMATTLMSFPPIVLAIGIIAALGTGLTNAMFAIGLMFTPRLFRIARAAAASVSRESFVEASRSIGASGLQIVRWHVLRNSLSPVVVYSSFAMGTALLIEASLSFLGLSVQPPDASWGAMLGRAFRSIFTQPLGVVFPGLAITFAVLSLNLVGDGLRDTLNQSDARQSNA